MSRGRERDREKTIDVMEGSDTWKQIRVQTAMWVKAVLESPRFIRNVFQIELTGGRERTFKEIHNISSAINRCAGELLDLTVFDLLRGVIPAPGTEDFDCMKMATLSLAIKQIGAVDHLVNTPKNEYIQRAYEAVKLGKPVPRPEMSDMTQPVLSTLLNKLDENTTKCTKRQKLIEWETRILTGLDWVGCYEGIQGGVDEEVKVDEELDEGPAAGGYEWGKARKLGKSRKVRKGKVGKRKVGKRKSGNSRKSCK